MCAEGGWGSINCTNFKWWSQNSSLVVALPLYLLYKYIWETETELVWCRSVLSSSHSTLAKQNHAGDKQEIGQAPPPPRGRGVLSAPVLPNICRSTCRLSKDLVVTLGGQGWNTFINRSCPLFIDPLLSKQIMWCAGLIELRMTLVWTFPPRLQYVVMKRHHQLGVNQLS